MKNSNMKQTVTSLFKNVSVSQIALIALAAFNLTGCGDNSSETKQTRENRSTVKNGTTSCVVKHDNVELCQEYTNIQHSQEVNIAQNVCADSKGVFTVGQACPRSNALVGCIQGEPSRTDSKLVIWYYKSERLKDFSTISQLICGGKEFQVQP